MLMPKQILEISSYIFEILQVINSLCSVFMTAILLMMLFIMFCSSHLAILAGMINCLSTIPEVREHLLKMSIIYIDCMSAQINPFYYCLGGSFSSNLLWIHGHALSRVGYHGSDITKESFALPSSMGLWMLPMLGIISVMLASPSSCLQATLAVHGACSNSARIHMPLLLPLGPSQTFLLLQLPTPSGKIFGWLYSMGRLGVIVLIYRTCGVHGNPNAVCIDRGKCTKGFPKPFSDETVMTADGYPTYRRRNTGTHEIHAGGRVTSIDNGWVVPYNRYLSGRYECHINVEVCISVHATNNIHKYIFKGHDRITAVM